MSLVCLRLVERWRARRCGGRIVRWLRIGLTDGWDVAGRMCFVGRDGILGNGLVVWSLERLSLLVVGMVAVGLGLEESVRVCAPSVLVQGA